jgi:hypothetical protein
LPVVEDGDVALRRTNLVSAERQAPLVEEVPEGKAPVDRRLDVDDAVGGVRVQPVKALAGGRGRQADQGAALATGTPS